MDENIEKYIIDKLNRIKENFEKIDQKREIAIKLNRELINLSNRVMASIYSGDHVILEEMTARLSEKYREVRDEFLKKDIDPYEYQYYIKILRDGLKEYTEAILFYSVYRGEYSKLKSELESIPDEPFMDGLFEFIGELRRLFLDALGNRDIKKAEETLGFMKTLYNNLLSIGLKSFYVKDFKHKVDVIKQIMLRSMQDYIIALYSKEGGKINE